MTHLVATHHSLTLLRLLAVLSVGFVTPVHAAQPQWHLQVGGISHHFEETKAVGRRWQEQHPGLGLERRIQDGAWSQHAAGGVLQDSRGFWGGYAGASYLYNKRWSGVLDTGIGMGAYAFYRSTSWNGKMGLVPGILPMASLTIPGSDVGFNFIYVPHIGSYNKAMPAVLHAQMTVRFR